MTQNVPIVIIVFNRPKNTRLLLDEIKKTQPEKLYVISDGPRKNKLNENELVIETRKMFDNLDWQCKVYRNFSDKNMGVKNRIISGLNWVFQNEDKAIILEDDCIPTQDFFLFCSTMLERYSSDNRIFSISGTNFFYDKLSVKESYFFSRYHSCWGWATWKRAWTLLDENLDLYNNRNESKRYLTKYLSSSREGRYWVKISNKIKLNRIDSWAYIWSLTNYRYKSLQIVPKNNLIRNIGFDSKATHTVLRQKYIKNKTQPYTGVYIHPQTITFHSQNDRLRRNLVFSKSPRAKLERLLSLIIFKLKLLLK